jgi:hypothetical protein
VLWNPIEIESVQTPRIHVFDTIVDAGFDHERAVKLDDFWGDGSMKNIEFHDDPVDLGLIEFETDFLRGRHRFIPSVSLDPSTPQPPKLTFMAMVTLVGL